MAKIGEEKAAQTEPPQKEGLLSRMAGNVKQGWDELRIGDGHASAMLRLGLKELRNAANPSRESVSATDQGLYGEVTPGEIDRTRGEGDDPLHGPMTMKDLQAAAQEKTKDEGRGMEEQQRSRGMEL